MTWNMMCRPGHLGQCDNCAVRFQRIAEAIDGGKGFTGVPDFDGIDIIVAQELFLTKDSMHMLEPVHQALARKGFKVYQGGLSNAVRPTPWDPLCKRVPPQQDLFRKQLQGWQELLVDKSRIPINGGLVTWSKLPFVDMTARRWCYNVFPAPHGYTIAHLTKGGYNIFAINSHLSPVFPALQGIDKTFRAYQFSEMVAEVKAIAASMQEPFVVLYGGDSNEDAFQGKKHNAEWNVEECNVISEVEDIVKQNLAAIGLDDLEQKCNAGVFARYKKKGLYVTS